MRRVHFLLLGGGAVLAVGGAILAFALQPGRPPDWPALGLISLILGVALVLGVGAERLASAAGAVLRRELRPPGDGEADEISSLAQSARAIGGLLAVFIGTAAVLVLGLATLALLRAGAEESSMVALATSAFGVISAVVGAYLGIKVGAEQTQEATETTRAVVKRSEQVDQTARAVVQQTQEASKTAQEASMAAQAAARTAEEEATRAARNSSDS